jgi:hypothetical protein
VRSFQLLGDSALHEDRRSLADGNEAVFLVEATKTRKGRVVFAIRREQPTFIHLLEQRKRLRESWKDHGYVVDTIRQKKNSPKHIVNDFLESGAFSTFESCIFSRDTEADFYAEI